MTSKHCVANSTGWRYNDHTCGGASLLVSVHKALQGREKEGGGFAGTSDSTTANIVTSEGQRNGATLR